MLFNSIKFLLFFPAVMTLYFVIPHRFRWTLLLGGSYYFYMCWRPDYIFLIIVSTITAYSTAILMSRHDKKSKKRKYLILSLVVNLGLLFFFKYYNFLNESVTLLLNRIDLQNPLPALNVVLPVGISFYTFQTLSYTIDVYRGQKRCEKHLGIFALYVSYFPQLVAGPIERSKRLLPQFFEKHYFDYCRVTDGLKLMAWGFFKKMVIADRLALYVNGVYNNPSNFHGFAVIVATYFFAFQIYCDFSGYSDIAIGAAQVMGFRLMENFKRPYFSKSLSDFWNRWHISLSTWLRDYLFLPFAYSISRHIKKDKLFYIKAEDWAYCAGISITMLLGGLWHGANWTFVIWGILHGTYLVFGRMTRKPRKNILKKIGLIKRHSIHNLIRIFFTFHLICFAWIFFRANSISDAFVIIKNMFTNIQIHHPGIDSVAQFSKPEILISIIGIMILVLVQLFQSRYSIRKKLSTQPVFIRWSLYLGIILSIIIFGNFSGQEFIYFQF